MKIPEIYGHGGVHLMAHDISATDGSRRVEVLQKLYQIAQRLTFHLIMVFASNKSLFLATLLVNTKTVNHLKASETTQNQATNQKSP